MVLFCGALSVLFPPYAFLLQALKLNIFYFPKGEQTQKRQNKGLVQNLLREIYKKNISENAGKKIIKIMMGSLKGKKDLFCDKKKK